MRKRDEKSAAYASCYYHRDAAGSDGARASYSLGRRRRSCAENALFNVALRDRRHAASRSLAGSINSRTRAVSDARTGRQKKTRGAITPVARRTVAVAPRVPDDRCSNRGRRRKGTGLLFEFLRFESTLFDYFHSNVQSTLFFCFLSNFFFFFFCIVYVIFIS